MTAVSIVVPTRNGAATLPAALDAIAAQRYDGAVEVVVVDSGSTDGTIQLVEPRVDRLLRVPPERFNHGLTRNLGISASRGELVVLLVQDAVPASADWLSTLTEPLRKDERLAGTYARQVPHVDAGPVTRHHLAGYRAGRDGPRVSFIGGAAAFSALSPRERFEACAFDNVCSCLRRSAWSEHPFPETPVAEDLEWARAVLLAGWGLAYVPDSVVMHSHERSARYELERSYAVNERVYRLFGFAPIPTPLHLAVAVAGALVTYVRCVVADDLGSRRGRGSRRGPCSRGGRSSRRRELRRALAMALVWPLGQYLGALAARRGWTLLRPQGV